MNYMLNPVRYNAGASTCTCISPALYINGYVSEFKKLIPVVKEMELVNKLVKHVYPQLSFKIYNYQKNNPKKKVREIFTEQSVDLLNDIFNILDKISSYNGEPIKLSSPCKWSIFNKLGLIFCQSSKLIKDKIVELGNNKMPYNGWVDFVKSTYNSVLNSGVFDPYFIFPFEASHSDFLWEGGTNFGLTTEGDTLLNSKNLTYLYDTIDVLGRKPTHIVLVDKPDDPFIVSFAFDYSLKGGAKHLYHDVIKLHELFPEFDYYRYNGKSKPFYYPLDYRVSFKK